jgi:hypothetical protein
MTRFRCASCSTTTFPSRCGLILLGHQVETAYEPGWAQLTDKGIRFQQNLEGRKLALVIIDTNDWMRIRRSISVVVEAISGTTPGTLVHVEVPRK